MLNKANREADAAILKIAALKQEYSVLKSKIKSVIQAQTDLLDSVDL
jgi:hypothetical protein